MEISAVDDLSPNVCRNCCVDLGNSVPETHSSSPETSRSGVKCSACNCGSYCSQSCLESHQNHQQYCEAICSLQKLETQKQLAQCVYGIDSDKVPYKVKRKLISLVGDRPLVKFFLDGKFLDGLWDTGAMVSLLSAKYLQENFPDVTIQTVAEFLGEGEKEISLTAANKGELKVKGVAVLNFGINDDKEELFQVPFLITNEEISRPILGYNLIEYLVSNFKDVVDLPASMTQIFGGLSAENSQVMVNLVESTTSITAISQAAKLDRKCVIAPGTVRKVRCKVKGLDFANPHGKIIVFSPFEELCVEKEIVILETTEKLTKHRKFVDVCVYNPTGGDVVLEKGTELGVVSDASAAFPLPIVDGERQESCAVNEVQVEEGDGSTLRFELDGLSEDEEVEARSMLEEEKEVFSLSKDDIGLIPDFKLKIELTDNIPVAEPYRKIPRLFYDEVKSHIGNLLANGWIKESSSQYASPMVCVRKKDGGLRLCIDYRKLNLKTIPDKQPIPRIQDILDGLGGNSWFSTLDMSQAYHQGLMHEDSRRLTAFSTPWALFEWIRIPYGIMNAPPGFQRFIYSCLARLIDKCCSAYLDDVLVYSKSFQDHKRDLKSVLKTLRLKGVKLNLKKCHLFKREVKYLGRLVSENGYRPDPEDTKALDKCLVAPTNVGQLRTLVGFLGYYRTYIQDFSRKLKPIYDLLQGKTNTNGKVDSRVKIQWTNECQKVVEEMVAHLKSPAVIAYPDFSLPFVIHCDASQKGLGAVLYQKVEGKLKVVCFASRTLTPAERNYHLHSGKLEFLALKWAVVERFRDYLINGPAFEVVTDNNPLTYVLTTAKLNATGLRWIAELANFRFTIRYRSGKKHVDADYLSRHAIDDFKQLEEEADVSVSPNDANLIFSSASRQEVALNRIQVEVKSIDSDPEVQTIPTEELVLAQQNDPVISPVLDLVARDQWDKKEMKKLGKESRILARQRSKLSVVNGVLLRKTKTLSQVVLPKVYHNLVYVELHEKMHHLGSERVVELARQRFYWPQMQKQIEFYIKKQCRCLMAKQPAVPARAELVPIETSYPFQMIGIDYMELDVAKGGFRYVLVVVDHFTRYIQMYATKKKSGMAAADKIFNDFILRYGFPERIHHDQGREFNNSLFNRLHQLTDIEASNTTPYHPQGNGQTERMNRTIQAMLKTLEEKEKENWPKHLQKLAFSFNATINKSTGFSPHYLMFGRSPRLPIDRMFGVDVNEGEANMQISYARYAQEWTEKMNQAFEIAGKHAVASGNQNKHHYGKKVRGVDIVVGDRVLSRNRTKGGTGKMRKYWEEMIYVVVDKDEHIPVYTIKPEKGRGRMKRVHRNDIMRCTELQLQDPVPSTAKLQKPQPTKPTKPANKLNMSAPVVVDAVPETVESDDDSESEQLVGIVRDMQEVPEATEADDARSDDTPDVVNQSDDEPDDVVNQSDTQTDDDNPEEEAVSSDQPHVEEEALTDDRDHEEEQTQEADSESEPSSEEEEETERRSSRQRKPTRTFTYKTLGGNPTYANVHKK